MHLKSYKITCAKCHDNEIKGDSRAGDKGLLFIAIPGLDLETLKQKNAGVGQWPEDAEGELNTFMVTLLSNQPGFSELYQTIKHLDLEDLSEATANELDTVVKLAWTIKTFIYELSQNGSEKFINNSSTLADLKLCQKTPYTHNDNCFSDLEQDISNHKAHKTNKSSPKKLSHQTHPLKHDTKRMIGKVMVAGIVRHQH